MKRIVVAGLALLAIVAVLWAWRGHDPAPKPHRDVGREPDAAPAQLDVPAVAPAAPAAPERQAVPDTQTATAATVRGRCVDERGEPLAGCRVALSGAANDTRLQEWLVDHDPIDWQDPVAQTTGVDGRFVFTFEPPPPYCFCLRLAAEQRLRMEADWDQLAPGAVRDVGDVVLRGGCRVSGEVVDQHGQPVDGAEVTFDQLNRGQDRSAVVPRRLSQAKADTAGRFVLRDLVSAGNWTVSVSGAGTRCQLAVEVPPASNHFVRFALERPAFVERPRITGIVVDDAGAPVVGAMVLLAAGFASGMSTTNDAGEFRIERQPAGADKVRLKFTRSGYWPLDPPEEIPWGAHDRRFVMRRGADIEVQVIDAVSRRPVEDYTLLALPQPGTVKRIYGRDYAERARGAHGEGRTSFGPLLPGRYLLVVSPRGDTWSDAILECEVTTVPTQRFLVEVSALARRTLVVQRSDGTPVVGTRFELLQPLSEHPVDIETLMLELARPTLSTSANQARGLLTGMIDQRGESQLVGPPNVALALRLLGPGHTPLVVSGLRLDQASPLVVTVSVGATLFGRVRPPELVAQLQQEGGPQPMGRPGVRLRRKVDGKVQTLPVGSSAKVPLDDDGSFRIEGIAPGTWHLQLCWAVQQPLPGLMGFVSPQSMTVATVADLRDSEVREQDLSLDTLVRGTLRAMVRIGGQPWANGEVEFSADLGLGSDGEARRIQRSARTDADGHLEVALPAGDYRATATVPGGGFLPCRLPSSTTAFVPRGQTVETTIEFTAGSLQLRIVREDGSPIPGATVQLHGTDELPWFTPPSDASGAISLALAPVGTLQVSILPHELQDARAQRAFHEANRHDADAWRRTMIPVGAITVAATGEVRVQTLTVPARAGY